MLLLDSGDMLFARRRNPFDSRVRKRSRAAFLIEAHGRMGLDAWAVSRLDLRYGLDALQAEARAHRIELLSANLVDRHGACVLRPYALRERNGVRIGLIGLTGPWGSPDGAPSPGEGLQLIEPEAAASRALREIEGRADLVVVLSSLGMDRDERLAGRVDGLHIILGAGDDRMILIPRRVADSLLLQPYRRGEYLGMLEIAFRAPVPPMLDDRDREQLERALLRTAPGSADAARLRLRLEPFGRQTSYRAALRPLTEQDPDDEALAAAVEKQLELEADLH
ncbi:MAG: hypothetical protein JXR96_09510 [Deltaproteobacteria bacterium]|nr:hypothetical protein [Deltaproteobacteria bacterium]